MIIIAYLLSFLSLILIGSLFVNLKPPYSFLLAFSVQWAAAALSPFLAVMGLVGAGLGWLYHAPIAVAAGLLGAGISVTYIALVTAPQPGFDLAFGKDWKTRVAPPRRTGMLKRRWGLGWPRTGEPRWERDIPFWTIPGTDRALLCDVWQPPAGVPRSGLVFVYLHGAGWYTFDKDFGTRPFFHQLAAQGHVIMDVANRLCPEVDIYGMTGDVKRAVAWMKANAGRYGADPEGVVLGGGSSGGHLALLAAYAPDHPLLTPADVQGCDLSVAAVVSYYGPTDLLACYERLNQKRLVGKLPKVEIGLPGAAEMKKNMQDAGRLDLLLGGLPGEVPEVYALASPVSHVHPGCPPTLLIQGEADVITPAAATRALHRRLVECGVPAVNIIYPLTNHAFDLLLPQVSPPTHAALYYLERFLALISESFTSAAVSRVPEGSGATQNPEHTAIAG
jgi:acetyl esterase/lipase